MNDASDRLGVVANTAQSQASSLGDTLEEAISGSAAVDSRARCGARIPGWSDLAKVAAAVDCCAPHTYKPRLDRGGVCLSPGRSTSVVRERSASNATLALGDRTSGRSAIPAIRFCIRVITEPTALRRRARRRWDRRAQLERREPPDRRAERRDRVFDRKLASSVELVRSCPNPRFRHKAAWRRAPRRCDRAPRAGARREPLRASAPSGVIAYSTETGVVGRTVRLISPSRSICFSVCDSIFCVTPSMSRRRALKRRGLSRMRPSAAPSICRRSGREAAASGNRPNRDPAARPGVPAGKPGFSERCFLYKTSIVVMYPPDTWYLCHTASEALMKVALIGASGTRRFAPSGGTQPSWPSGDGDRAPS